MRLLETQRQAIKNIIADIVGSESRIWLFGSRVDDTLQGGDIDLLIETDTILPSRVAVLCKLEGRFARILGDRKIDPPQRRTHHPAAPHLPGSKRKGQALMSIDYLAEHADLARIALELAERKSRHLRYTWQTLYQEPIDLAWVKNLEKRENLAEKIDAFVGRFGRLQDHIGEKLLPAFARLLGEQPKSLVDVMAYAERMGWVRNAEEFIGARRLRNLLVHEYMTEAELFLEALIAAKAATELLFEVVETVRQEAVKRHLSMSK